MEGYQPTTYGAAFADVYDQWYAGLTDIPAFTAMAFGLALDDLPVLELGVGTGRLAAPLAAAGLTVVGVDASPEMLAVVPAGVTTVCGDMVDDAPPGPFGLAVLGFNTLFNLLTEGRQQACFDVVAQRLAPGACVIVENSLIDTDRDNDHTERVTVRSMTATEVVLAVSRADPAHQMLEGQYVSMRNGEPVRLRPWAIRWLSPAQQDDMAAAAGLDLVGRYADYRRSPLADDATSHVTVYRLPRESAGFGHPTRVG